MTSRDELLGRLYFVLGHRLKKLRDEEDIIRRQVRIQADEAERLKQKRFWAGVRRFLIGLALIALLRWLGVLR